MKAALIAAKKLNKNIPATHYAHADDITKNPVYITFSKDYDSVLALFKHKKNDKFRTKLCNSIFALWVDFEKRLDEDFMMKKFYELVEILMKEKEYDIAMTQCIDRLLLKHFHPLNKFVFNCFEELMCMLKNFDLNDSFTSILVEILVKRHQCVYEKMLKEDIMLTRQCSMPILLNLIKSLTLILQHFYLNNCYQWLILNISVHIYEMVQPILSLGYSHLVKDQLKWCVDWTGVRVPRNFNLNELTVFSIPNKGVINVICPGNSVEVYDIDEFEWRMQLAIALVQCYYDCCDESCAESWARKIVVELTKLRQSLLCANETFTGKCQILKKLLGETGDTKTNITREKKVVCEGCNPCGVCASCCGDNAGNKNMTEVNEVCPTGSFMINTELEKENDASNAKYQLLQNIKCHSIKFSMMIFKRAVVESRRRPKGFLPPENRFHANQLTKIPWPRSQTERLLDMLFEGSSAQFLAILVCLQTVCRKSCLKTFKIQTDEKEVLDVYEELFFAAQEIISGGGGDKKKGISDVWEGAGSMLKGLTKGDGTMFCMALQGLNGVCLDEVVEFIKLAYNYNQRNIINMWLNKMIDFLEDRCDCSCQLSELKVIKLVDYLTEMRGIKDDFVYDAVMFEGIENCVLELIKCIETMIQKNCDHDMILDCIHLIWKKVRCFLQPPTTLVPLVIPFEKEKAESMATRVGKLIAAKPNLGKWIDIMVTMMKMLQDCLNDGWLGVHYPEILLQICIFLGLLYEASSNYHPEESVASAKGVVHNISKPNEDAIEFFMKAKRCYESGLEAIENLHNRLSPNAAHYEKSIKEYLKVDDKNEAGIECEEIERLRKLLEEVYPILITLRLRTLIKLSHFCGVQIADCKEVNQIDYKPPLIDKHAPKTSNGPLDALLCGTKNNVIKAINLALQYVVVQECCFCPNSTKNPSDLLNKMAQEEYCFFIQHNKPLPQPNCPPCTIPPLYNPILLHKTEHTLILKPPLFCYPSLAYFKLFGCLATAAKRNKAGYLDTELTGCGTMVSATDDAVFVVRDLIPGQKYVFSCGAYTLDGETIVKVGSSTKPILTSNPVSFNVAQLVICELLKLTV